MHPTEILRRLGGVASWSTLVRQTSDRELRRLVDSGDILQVARGRYALPEVVEALTISHALTSTLSLRSAALHHGWEVARMPPVPDVTVARKRHLSPAQRRQATFRYIDLPSDDVVDGVTTPRRTLLDCLRFLPADEALAIADSALRHGSVTSESLTSLAGEAHGKGARQAREIAARARSGAANPFESVLRHLAGLVDGLEVVTQVTINDDRGAFLARPDLVDRELCIVIEADSFAFHSSRAALRRDCRRYTALTVHGWLVLWFTWEDVMHRPGYVTATIARALRVRSTEAAACARRTGITCGSAGSSA